MPNLNFRKPSLPISRHIPTAVGVSLCIGLAMVGALVLTSCATSPAGIARENHIYDYATNIVAGIHAIAPALPQPVGGALEGLLALASAGLALWSTHLHRQVSALRDQSQGGSEPPRLSACPINSPRPTLVPPS